MPVPPTSRSPFRAALERASAPALLRLSALPPWLVPVIMLALTLLGLIVSGPVGFGCLLLVALFLGWLAVLSWPQLGMRPRLLRVLVPLLLVVAAVLQL